MNAIFCIATANQKANKVQQTIILMFHRFEMSFRLRKAKECIKYRYKRKET